ncbi:MAG: galactitol system component [Tepidanaerobacteraceae bacterium]|nr:galactitol system component [Tepidanaerobacteraceae bacterium]
MEFLLSIINLGASVMMPIIIFIFGLIFKQGLSKSIRCGLMIGVGFIGINIVVQSFMGTITPITEALVKNSGFHLSVVDIGWPAASGIAWSSLIGPVSILIGVIINIIMISIGLIKTLDVDIWNYWTAFAIAQIGYYRTGNFWLAILETELMMIWVFFIADKTQKVLYNHYNIPAVSIPHVATQSCGAFAFPINWLLDRIPVVNKINWSPKNIQERFGVVGEPIFLGVVIGAVLSILAKQNYEVVLKTAIGLGAAMVLIPKMVSVLMEGLVPMAEGISEFISNRFKGKEVYIGMDSAIMVGDPANIALAVILIPITIILAVILPGNKVLPLGDLPATVYFCVVLTAVSKGNLFRGIIMGIPMMCAALWTSTSMAPYFTELAKQIGFAIPQGTTQITAIGVGIAWIPYLIQEVLTRLYLLIF